MKAASKWEFLYHYCTKLCCSILY